MLQRDYILLDTKRFSDDDTLAGWYILSYLAIAIEIVYASHVWPVIIHVWPSEIYC